MTCVSTLQVIPKLHQLRNHEQVAYEDVLKSRAKEIQSYTEEISRLKNFILGCDHSLVHTGCFTKIVIFFWASDRKTHAMRNCLYQEMRRTGNKFTQYVQSQSTPTVLSVKFCNRSAVFKVEVKNSNEMPVIVLNFFDPTENDGLLIERVHASVNELGIPIVSSWAIVRPWTNAGSQQRTFICTSLQLASNETEKLKQKLFSIVGRSPEVIVKSSITRNVSVTLDFDVLALNARRLGLLNDSEIELLSLSSLLVHCFKRDQYGLSNDGYDIIRTNMTDKLVVTTKSLLINDKLRIRVNVAVPVASDHSFGKYACFVLCYLQRKYSDNMTFGYVQMKNFSIVPNNWRDESLFCRRENKYCEERVDIITEEYGAIVTIFIIVFSVIVIRKLVQCVRRRCNLKTFTSMQHVLQSTKNTEKRKMKYDIFLSYSSKDRFWVKYSLLKFIESKGFTVCFDERDFPYGCNLVQAIPRAVYESHKVIAVVSPNYLSSRWCAQYEFVVTYTKILNKEAPENSLLLVKYKNCQMPEEMNCLKYLDYTTATAARDRSVFVKILSRLGFYKQPGVIETTREAPFYDSLLSWLGEPQVGERLR